MEGGESRQVEVVTAGGPPERGGQSQCTPRPILIEGEMSRRLRRNSIVRDKTNSLVKKNLRTSLTDVINRDLLTDCLATAAADRNEITILEVNNQFQFLKLCTLIVTAAFLLIISTDKHLNIHLLIKLFISKHLGISVGR